MKVNQTFNNGKVRISLADGSEAKEFDAKKEIEAAFAYQAELMARGQASSVTGTVRLRLTYRDQLQVVPAGQSLPAMTVTRDVMDAMIKDWPVIVATYEANAGKVAATYRDIKKSVGTEKAKEMPKHDLVLVQPKAAAGV